MDLDGTRWGGVHSLLIPFALSCRPGDNFAITGGGVEAGVFVRGSTVVFAWVDSGGGSPTVALQRVNSDVYGFDCTLEDLDKILSL